MKMKESMRLKELKTVYYAGRTWIVIGASGGHMIYLRAVTPINWLSDDPEKEVVLVKPPHNKVFSNWITSRLREYLNGEFLDTFPEEDRMNIIATSNIGYVNGKSECIVDNVWIDNLSNIRLYPYLDEAKSYDEKGNGLAEKIYPCICIDKDALDPMVHLFDRFSIRYNSGEISGAADDFVRMLNDMDYDISDPLRLFAFMWYNSDDREDIEKLFEIMTACPLKEFLEKWVNNEGVQS